MKLIHTLMLVVGALLVILYLGIVRSSPLNYLHFFVLIVVAAILLYLYLKYILKMYKMQKIERMLSYNEYIFGTTNQSEFITLLLKNQNLLDNEKIIQTLFRNYFTYHLSKSSDDKILCHINKLAASTLYNNSEGMKAVLNQAIALVGFKKFIVPCAEAIVEATEDGYKKMQIVELIEEAFKITDTKQLHQLREGVNKAVDIYTNVFTEHKRKIVNSYKMQVENQTEP